jgi:hypothetical protein
VVDLDAPLSQELLEVAVGQSVAQVPADGEKDDLRREPKAGKCRAGLLNRSNGVVVLRAGLVQPGYGHESGLGWIRLRSMQQCRVNVLVNVALEDYLDLLIPVKEILRTAS